MPDLTPEEIDVLIAPIVAEILESLFDPAAGARVTRQRVARALSEVAVQAVGATIDRQHAQLQPEQDSLPSLRPAPAESPAYQTRLVARIAGLLAK